MHLLRFRPTRVAWNFLTWLSLTASLPAAPLLDDRSITIHSTRELEAKRKELVRHLWGASGFPRHRQPDTVVTNIPSPVQALTDLARVDELRIRLAPDLEGLAYHFIPQRPNRALVVVHHGHGCTLDDDPSPAEAGYGLQRTIAALLREGYGVLGVFMPLMRPGDCRGDHEALFQNPDSLGNPIRLFLEPTAVSLNYLRTRSREGHFPRYREFHMIGLSGGGWTTTVYAAIDPTIRCSFPVAGSIPLYLRSGGSIGDREQFDPAFYRLAGYPDLYVLGACGRGRMQVQILVRKDDCCFGEAEHDAQATGRPYTEAMREYEGRVRETIATLGRGGFRLEFDEVAPSHMISHHAIGSFILPALKSSW